MGEQVPNCSFTAGVVEWKEERKKKEEESAQEEKGKAWKEEGGKGSS